MLTEGESERGQFSAGRVSERVNSCRNSLFTALLAVRVDPILEFWRVIVDDPSLEVVDARQAGGESSRHGIHGVGHAVAGDRGCDSEVKRGERERVRRQRLEGLPRGFLSPLLVLAEGKTISPLGAPSPTLNDSHQTLRRL